MACDSRSCDLSLSFVISLICVTSLWQVLAGRWEWWRRRQSCAPATSSSASQVDLSELPAAIAHGLLSFMYTGRVVLGGAGTAAGSGSGVTGSVMGTGVGAEVGEAPGWQAAAVAGSSMAGGRDGAAAGAVIAAADVVTAATAGAVATGGVGARPSAAGVAEVAAGIGACTVGSSRIQQPPDSSNEDQRGPEGEKSPSGVEEKSQPHVLLAQLLHAATKYLLPQLHAACLAVARERISVHSAVPWLMYAHEQGEGALRQLALEWAGEHYEGKIRAKILMWGVCVRWMELGWGGGGMGWRLPSFRLCAWV